MSQPLVLIIASDDALRVSFADDLRHAGWCVQTAVDAKHGMETAAASRPDLVVMPAQLPDEDVLEVCRRIRQTSPDDQQPTFVLAPQDPTLGKFFMSVDTVAGWQRLMQETETVHCGDLVIHYEKRKAWISDREVGLTATEFTLLWNLARRPGRVFSREQLTEFCRGQNRSVQARTIDVHIKSIRQKLGRAELIETVHGVGYRLREPE